MDNGDLEDGGGDLAFHGKGGRKYSPVGAHNRAVLEMSPINHGSSSSDSKSSVRKKEVVTPGNLDSDGREGSNPESGGANVLYREHKLELFGFDSLVSILGLKSMTGEQIPAVSSPRDGEDVSITRGQPKTSDVKMGTMMGVFVPCLQSILGIIYYIRFSWIVGMGGIGESLLLVSLCGLCTLLTGIH